MPVQTHSQYPLVSVADAQEVVTRESQTLPAEEVDLSQAAGRVLAETVTAKDDLPPFPASIKVTSILLSSACRSLTPLCGSGQTEAKGHQFLASPTQPSNPPRAAGRIRRGSV